MAKRYKVCSVSLSGTSPKRILGSFDNIFSAYWAWCKLQFKPTLERTLFFVESFEEVIE